MDAATQSDTNSWNYILAYFNMYDIIYVHWLITTVGEGVNTIVIKYNKNNDTLSVAQVS